MINGGKRLLLACICCTLSLTVPGQKKDKTAPSGASGDAFALQQAIYKRALSYNDLSVATQAVYTMIALAPDRKGLKDTLAQLYFQRGAWPQTVLVTTETLENNSENQAARELRAVAYQSLGMAKESLADYEQLFQQSNNVFHLYEIGTLQYSMRRFGECEQTVARLLADERIKGEEIMLAGQDGKNRQKVPLAAAVLNLRGVVDLDQGKKETAKEYFNAAIQLFPEFELAKNNLRITEGG